MPFARPKFRKSITSHSTGNGYYPDQVAAAYGFLAVKDAAVVGIVELGGAYAEADLAVFCQARSLPTPSVAIVPVGGATITPDPSGADVEVMLDVEVVAAAFPGATIRIYFADNTEAGFVAAVEQAVKECDVVSISWGGPEDQWSSSGMQQMNEAMASKPCFVASGDNGSGDGEKGKHADFPASAPHAIACGGTTLPSLTDLSTETAWSDGGGGVSTVFAKPSYQSSLPAALGSMRCEPDIAGCADPNTPYLIYCGGQWMPVGGTSAVSPLMAALFAALKAQTGALPADLHPLLYGPGACRDVIKGGNGAYQAGPGYDLVTGMGVPVPSALLHGLQGRPPVSPPPSPPPVPTPPPVPVPTPSPNPGPTPMPPTPTPPPLPISLPTLEQLIEEFLVELFADLEAASGKNPFLDLAGFSLRPLLRRRLEAMLVKANALTGQRAALPPGTVLTIIQTLLQDAPTIIADVEAIIAAIKGGAPSGAAA